MTGDEERPEDSGLQTESLESFPSQSAVRSPQSSPFLSPDLASRRLHPAWIAIGLVRSLRAFALPLLIFVVTGRQNWDAGVLLIGAGIGLVGVAARTASWWVFRYEVAGGELRVRSGLIARQERTVPLERVQTVDTGESPLQRVLGVVQVRIETAAGGGRGSDVTLEALTRDDAAALRQRLAVGPAGRSPGGLEATVQGANERSATDAAVRPLPETQGELIRAITPGALFVAGATSGRIGPAMAILFGAYQFVDDLVPESILERLAMSAPGFGLRVVLVVAGIVGVGSWLLAVVSTVLTFGGFALRREGDRLLIASGLLDRRRSTIPISRIQAITISEGMLRQPFGLAALRIESAGYATDSAESGVLFPLLRRSEIPALLAAACPDFAADAAVDGAGLNRLPVRARRRYLLADVWQLLILAVVAVAVLVRTGWLDWRWGLLPLALAPLAAMYGWVAFRDAGWIVDPAERLIVRTRQVARQTAILPRRRLQRRDVSQNPLQRRAALATLRVAVASGGSGGRVELAHLDEEVAGRLQAGLGPRRAVPARDQSRSAVSPATSAAGGP